MQPRLFNKLLIYHNFMSCFLLFPAFWTDRTVDMTSVGQQTKFSMNCFLMTDKAWCCWLHFFSYFGIVFCHSSLSPYLSVLLPISISLSPYLSISLSLSRSLVCVFCWEWRGGTTLLIKDPPLVCLWTCPQAFIPCLLITVVLLH